MRINKKIYLLAIIALFVGGCDNKDSSSISLLPSNSTSSTSNIPSSIEPSTSSKPSTSNVPSISNTPSASNSSSVAPTPSFDLQTKYEVKYDLGTRKTAKMFDNAEDIYNAFQLTNEEGIISSIDQFEYAYGGGNGGKSATAWYAGDMIKIGTTSNNGSVTFNLTKKVTQIKLAGYSYVSSGKLQVGDATSLDWGTESDNKTTSTTCEGLNETSKEVVESKQINEITIEFESTDKLKIATTNKKPLFITGIEFIIDPNEDVTPKKEFNVTWKNENGETLKVTKVKEGKIPSYDGEKPTKTGDDTTIYVFSGWQPALAEIHEDMTYTATFVSYDKDKAYPSSTPILSTDNTSIEYGYYPQSHVNDQNLINLLSMMSPINEFNWYLHENTYYVKEVANVYNNEQYTFDDGTSIINGNEYWFRCEPIKWNVLNNSDGSYSLLSSKLLDAHNYYSYYETRTINGESILPNNYEYSDIREFLNNDFYSVAFKTNDSYIQTSTSENNDKIYLLTYQDYLNASYGFETNLEEQSLSRECKTTDYARVRGSWYNKGDKNANLKYNGSYWTRSATEEYDYCAWNVNTSGLLSKYAVDGSSHSVRPSITIKLDK